MSINFSIVSNSFFDDHKKNRTLSGKIRDHEAIYIRLHDKPYKDWVIQIDDLALGDNDNLRCAYTVVSVPKKIPDEKVFSEVDKMQELLATIIVDVLERTLSNTE